MESSTESASFHVPSTRARKPGAATSTPSLRDNTVLDPAAAGSVVAAGVPPS